MQFTEHDVRIEGSTTFYFQVFFSIKFYEFWQRFFTQTQNPCKV